MKDGLAYRRHSIIRAVKSYLWGEKTEEELITDLKGIKSNTLWPGSLQVRRVAQKYLNDKSRHYPGKKIRLKF